MKMPQVIDKGSVIITKYSVIESMSMVDSQPYLRGKEARVIDSEVKTIMNSHGLSFSEAKKIRNENLEWACK